MGLGYTVSAISAQEIDEIDVVEIEQCLIDWAHQGVTTRLAAISADPRIRLHVGDVRLVLQGQYDALVGPWDAIVLDVDNGPDFLIYGQNRALYTEGVLRAAYARLTAGGTLAIRASPPRRCCGQCWNTLRHLHVSTPSKSPVVSAAFGM